MYGSEKVKPTVGQCLVITVTFLLYPSQQTRGIDQMLDETQTFICHDSRLHTIYMRNKKCQENIF